MQKRVTKVVQTSSWKTTVRFVEQWPFDNICGLQCPRDSLTTFETDGDAAAAGSGGSEGTESSTAEGRRHFQHYKVEAKAAAKAEEERRNNITKLGPFGPFAFLIS